jgi:hypothetical protein
MRESARTPTPVALDARQQQITTMLASTGEGPKLKTVHDHGTSGAAILRDFTKEHELGREAETIRWPNPDQEPAVQTPILVEDTTAKRDAIRWARERESTVGAGLWIWWTDWWRSDEDTVGAPAVSKPRDQWIPFRSHLGTRGMEVCDAELWAIGLALVESVRNRYTRQTHVVKNVAGFRDSQAAI